jgi:nucleoside-diphosphate-sugar epimerase
MLNLLRAAFGQDRDRQPGRFVAVRTPGELSAMNPYAASKAAAWQFCAMYARTRGWPIVGVMPFQTYGPGQHDRHLVSGAMAAAMAGEDFAMTEGSQEKDWIYIDDVVSGLLAVGDADLPPGTNIELGTGVLSSVAAMVSRVYEVAGQGGKPLFGALPSRTGEVQAHAADVETARALTGWQAAVSIDEGLARYHSYLQARST